MESVTDKWSQLQTCRICLVPFEFLSNIASVVSSPPTGDQYDDIMTELFDARAAFFASWCKTNGLTEHHLHGLDDQGFLAVLGTCIYQVKHGVNHHGKSDLASDTIRNYVTSAYRFLEWILGRGINISDPHSTGKVRKLHPFLRAQLEDRRRFQQPTPKKEPYTMDMFLALHRWLTAAPKGHSLFLGKVSCVYDWPRLGIITGFRIGEYGQNDVSRDRPFNRLPFDNDVPAEFRGLPVAMIADDFSFFDPSYTLISHRDLERRSQLDEVTWLEIRWRYDKSAHNYAKLGHSIFCPVGDAISIIRRSQL